MTITSSQVFHSLKKAQEIAAAMNASEDDWSYIVIDCKNGFGRIDVIDEDSEVVFSGFSL